MAVFAASVDIPSSCGHFQLMKKLQGTISSEQDVPPLVSQCAIKLFRILAEYVDVDVTGSELL